MENEDKLITELFNIYKNKSYNETCEIINKKLFI